MMPPGEYTITIKQIELCLFLPVTDIVKYIKSQFYTTNLTVVGEKKNSSITLCQRKKNEQTSSKIDCPDHVFSSGDSIFTWYMTYNNH